jgi:hypothetical protein
MGLGFMLACLCCLVLFHLRALCMFDLKTQRGLPACLARCLFGWPACLFVLWLACCSEPGTWLAACWAGSLARCLLARWVEW